jgi:hypothetical protein
MKLKVKINNDLNYIDSTGEVKELAYYETAINIWFEARK